MVGLFDRFTKKDEEDYGGEMVEEKPSESYKPEPMETEPMETASEPEPTPDMTETSSFEPQLQTSSAASSIGIDALMDKRVKLEEAIDYVGVMIKNLKDKRTKLEKNRLDVIKHTINQ